MTYVGWLYAWGEPLTLIGDDEVQIAEARRELVRIGIDNVTGATSDPVDELAAGTNLRSYRVADFAALADVIDADGTVVLDVRQSEEFQDGHVRGALNVPVHELTERIGELPRGDIWVHCATGYRASVAASLLDLVDRAVVLIDDEFDNAQGLMTN